MYHTDAYINIEESLQHIETWIEIDEQVLDILKNTETKEECSAYILYLVCVSHGNVTTYIIPGKNKVVITLSHIFYIVHT